jgi:hypothetical protein
MRPTWRPRVPPPQGAPDLQAAFLDMCPADLTADLKNFGSQSWPAAEHLLKAA